MWTAPKKLDTIWGHFYGKKQEAQIGIQVTGC